jgi:transcriptional regulator GlxA family with amidase domain
MQVIDAMQLLRDTGRMSSPRIVVIVGFDGVQPLDLVGPHEVFAGADQLLATAEFAGCAGSTTGYELIVAGYRSTDFRGESGLPLRATHTFDQLSDVVIDTLVIPGGNGAHDMINDTEFVEAVGALARRAQRIATICTGAFIAAAAGLLNGRKVTTHWARAAQLQRRFADLDVDADAIWLRDGDVWSSAGVTSGMDLALAIVEADHGPAVAQEVARWLVVFLRRPGGQSQFAAPVWRPAAGHPCVRRAQEVIAGDPTDDHRVDLLARRVGMSGRHFARMFTSELGESPGRYVERVRVETGRNLLETTDEAVTAVATLAGFRSSETFRRAFIRIVGVAPDLYRRRFRHTPTPLPSSLPHI